MRIQKGRKRAALKARAGSGKAEGGVQRQGLQGGEGPLEGPGRWRKTAVLACILTALVTLRCSRPVEVGQKAPEFSLTSLKGDTVSLGRLRGKVVFLHFWATWCPPCLVELPGLLRFFQVLDREKHVLLAVCVDNERPSRIAEFVKSWGVEIPVYLDPGGSLARRYGTFRYPETYLLDHDGRVCGKVIGAGDWKMSKWARILHACAGEADEVTKGLESDP